MPQLIYGMLSVYLLVVMYYTKIKFHNFFLSPWKCSLSSQAVYAVSMHTELKTQSIPWLHTIISHGTASAEADKHSRDGFVSFLICLYSLERKPKKWTCVKFEHIILGNVN